MTQITDRPHWYIVKTNSHQERLARLSLRDERIETYLPLVAKRNKNDELYGAPLFPSYLFASLTIGAPGWSKLFSARGVKCVLGTGGKPTRLCDQVVDEIRAREVDGYIELGVARPDCAFQPGQRVTVRKGAFARLDAIFVERVDSRRANILIQLLGESPRLAKTELAHIS